MQKRLIKKIIYVSLGLIVFFQASAVCAKTPTEIAKLLPFDGTFGDMFGTSVSMDGNTALIGASGDDDNGVDSGSAYIFTLKNGRWKQQQKLTAPDGAAGDNFGFSVSVDANTALIGAFGGSGSGKGSAYVFVRKNGHWKFQDKLQAPRRASWDIFGWSVSVDGNTALIGATGENNKNTGSGSAYVFVRNKDRWKLQYKLSDPYGTAFSQFGTVSLDGNTALIGANGDVSKGKFSGSASIFTGEDWSKNLKLTPADGAINDHFGWSVSVNNNTALIGALYDDDEGVDSGSAYVFVRQSNGHWKQQSELTASDGETNDHFGWSVSVDGNTALVGAQGDDDKGTDSGSAYVFVRKKGRWKQQHKLTASDGAAKDYFGWSVSVDRNTALIGAVWDNDNGEHSGSAYVFSLAKEANTE